MHWSLQLRCQYLYFVIVKSGVSICTFVRVKREERSEIEAVEAVHSSLQLLRCQYLYCCSSKASKLSRKDGMHLRVPASLMRALLQPRVQIGEDERVERVI